MRGCADAIAVVALGLTLAQAGCTLITASDLHFEDRAPPRVCGNAPGSLRKDLVVSLFSMEAHRENLTVIDLVRINSMDPMRRVVARAVYDPLGAPQLDIVLPCTVSGDRHEVDLFADFNNNGVYDPCPDPGNGCTDHQWRLPVQPDGTVAYRHNVDFRNISEDPARPMGDLPLIIVWRHTASFEQRLVEVRLRRLETLEARETVFLYRRQAPMIPAGMEERQTFAQTLVAGQDYEAVIWIDLNGNGTYDRPSTAVAGRDYATAIDVLGEPPSGAQVVIDGDELLAPLDVEI
jgi:hypothetical protein